MPINVKFADQKRYYAGLDWFYGDEDPLPMIRLIREAVAERRDRQLMILSKKAAESMEEGEN